MPMSFGTINIKLLLADGGLSLFLSYNRDSASYLSSIFRFTGMHYFVIFCRYNEITLKSGGFFCTVFSSIYWSDYCMLHVQYAG